MTENQNHAADGDRSPSTSGAASSASACGDSLAHLVEELERLGDVLRTQYQAEMRWSPLNRALARAARSRRLRREMKDAILDAARAYGAWQHAEADDRCHGSSERDVFESNLEEALERAGVDAAAALAAMTPWAARPPGSIQWGNGGLARNDPRRLDAEADLRRAAMIEDLP